MDVFLSQQYEFYLFSICALISTALIVLFTLRAIIDFKGIVNDIQNPVLFGVLPTYCMALMILSTYAKIYIGDLAVGIWTFALILSFVMMFFFVKKFVLHFDVNKVFPSWFVIFVGYGVACVVAPTLGVTDIGRIVFWLCFIGYLIMLPTILYRLIKVGNIPEPVIPNIAIFASPAALCLVAYVAVYGSSVNAVLMAVLTVMTLTSYFIILAYLPKMMKRKFYPSYAAFTFPLVISMVAVQRMGTYYSLTSNSVFTAFQVATVAMLC